jgi:FixJ family two-component response regulator
LRDTNGDIESYAAIIRDISERKRAAAICALRPLPRLPLIMLTSLGHNHQTEVEGVACFVAELTKPVKPSQLYDAIIGALTIEPEADGTAEQTQPQSIVDRLTNRDRTYTLL